MARTPPRPVDKPHGREPPAGDADAEPAVPVAGAAPGASRARLPARIAKRAVMLGITGVSLYLVFPTLMSVLGSAPEVATIHPRWFVAMAVLQAGSVFCQVELQRIPPPRGAPPAPPPPPPRRPAPRRPPPPPLPPPLAGPASARIAPGGAPAAATIQYGMLVRAGVPATAVASGL